MNIGKVQGDFVLPITNERIEIRTKQDISYIRYRMNRLKKEYPEKFKTTKETKNESL